MKKTCVADGAQAARRCADAEADDRLLGDGRVLDAPVAELGEEAVEHVEDAVLRERIVRIDLQPLLGSGGQRQLKRRSGE